MQAYGPVVKPVRDKSEWEHVNAPVVKPPFYEKVVGRPSSKKIRKGPEENEDGTKLSKHGSLFIVDTEVMKVITGKDALD